MSIRILTNYLLQVQGLVLLLAACAIAQELRPGMTSAAVSALLGVPNDKSSEDNDVSRWKYGNSIVLFTNGRVAGWSDEGELTTYIGQSEKVDQEELFEERKKVLIELLQEDS